MSDGRAAAADYLAEVAGFISVAGTPQAAWAVARHGLTFAEGRRDQTWAVLRAHDLDRLDAEDPEYPGIVVDTPERREIAQFSEAFERNQGLIQGSGSISWWAQWNIFESRRAALETEPARRLLDVDPFGGSGNDYDLFLLDQDLNVIAQSIDFQNGAQDPIEVVDVVNQSGNDAVAHVVIDRFGNSDTRRLELFCLGASALEHVTAAGSIVGHPALDEVVAVAAIDAADPGLDQVEAFSSRGPARIDFPAREDRARPDLAGFDGVSISNAGGFPSVRVTNR